MRNVNENFKILKDALVNSSDANIKDCPKYKVIDHNNNSIVLRMGMFSFRVRIAKDNSISVDCYISLYMSELTLGTLKNYEVKTLNPIPFFFEDMNHFKVVAENTIEKMVTNSNIPFAN